MACPCTAPGAQPDEEMCVNKEIRDTQTEILVRGGLDSLLEKLPQGNSVCLLYSTEQGGRVIANKWSLGLFTLLDYGGRFG